MTDRQEAPGHGSMNTDGLRPATGLLADLGARIPLVAAPMAGGPSTPALVLAAAGAGGLGFLAGGYKTPEQLADQITYVRAGSGQQPQERRDKDVAAAHGGTEIFGVNLFVPNPVPVDRRAFRAYAEALHDVASHYGVSIDATEVIEDDDHWNAKLDLLTSNPVPAVSFTFGLPSAQAVRHLRKAGTLVVQTVTNAAEAQQAEAIGVDALVVQSHAAGGHWGTWTPRIPAEQIPLAELLDQVRSRTGLPLWGAGGVSTPEGAAEVLAHGAEAAVVGTVLLRSPESGASTTYKAALEDHGRSETVVTTSFSGRPARALRNGFVDRFHALAPAGYPAIHHLTSPLRQAAAAAGDPEGINIWAGTGFRDAAADPAAHILRRLARSPV